jgi:hypothetical protein
MSLAATRARIDRITARMRRRRIRQDAAMDPHGKAPLRYIKGERIVAGAIHQVLGCGHTLPARLDADGCWTGTRRRCTQCKSGAAWVAVVIEPLWAGERGVAR